MKEVCSLVLATAIGLGPCLLLAPTKVFASKKGDKHFAQGLQYEATRQWEKATEEFALAVAANPSEMEYLLHFRRAKFNASQMYVLQGRALAKQRDYLGAYNAFKQAYGFDPENALIASEMERVLKVQREWEGTNGPVNGNVAKTAELPNSVSPSAVQAQKTPLPPSSTEQPRVLPEKQETNGSLNGNVVKTGELRDSLSTSGAQAQKTLSPPSSTEQPRALREKEATNGSLNGNVAKTGELRDSVSQAQAQKAPLPPSSTEQTREKEATDGSAIGNVAKTAELRSSVSPSVAQAQKALPPSSTEQSREKEATNGSAIGNVAKTSELRDSVSSSAAQTQKTPLPSSTQSPEDGGTGSGTATDQTVAIIPVEKLTLANKATGELRKTMSDGAGQFSLAGVLPREYLVKREAEGSDSAQLPITVSDKPLASSSAVKGPSTNSVKGAPPQNGQNGKPSMEIRRVSRPPKLEDFLEMQPNSELAPQMAKVDSFIQRNPKDGSPASQRTEVYLGYDDKNFYSIFVCFDNEPKSVRARMVRREDISGDDAVELMLDTFNDQRRAYSFRANPFGIQLDALFTEGSKDEEAEREGFDPSYDTLWYSSGKLTDRGYVVWMAIPFRSLRFSSKDLQHWGILLNRDIPRLNEEAFWPQYSNRIEGRLNQMATADGLQRISPGRNMQFIPYGIFRSARSLDTRDPEMPGFRKRTEVDGGLDAKFGIKDSMVVDVAVNPDFNQVESDEPQVTVTERFEVEFPEKRPFFLENANYFHTPLNLVFTRRIVDPQFGVRATGKLGPYALGAFVIDDQAPGKSVLPDDPLHGKRARFGIFRVNRDIFSQSTIGAIYTDREFAGSSNRVFGVDGRFKLNENWVAGFQAVKSWSQFLDGSKTSGSAYNATVSRTGRSFGYDFAYKSFSPDFHTEAGFVERTDIHDFKQTVEYRFRPEGKYLISWGPRFATQGVFDHSGLRLDFTQNNSISFELIGDTEVGFEYNLDRERLRPKDFPVLTENRDFRRNEKSIFFKTSYFDWFTFEGQHAWGTLVNFDPPEDHEPFLANATESQFLLTLRPRNKLRIDNTYLLTRLHDQLSKANILTNHIIRSKWNYQFSRELSLRVILQYDAVLTNPEFTDEDFTKNFNADFLLTYLINPWTALYVGYNNNRQNIALVPTDSGAEIVRRRNQFINDGRQLFIKFSYLLRF